MKIKLYFYCVLIITVLYPASARARTSGRGLKKLIKDSDIVASVTATKVLQQDDKVSCELLVDKFFKRYDSVDKNLAITMPRPRPGQRPRPDSVAQGQRYLVFLKRQDSALRLADEILGVIHLRGEKKMRNYVLDGSPAKLKRLNEPELLARVQELTADIAEPMQMPKTEKPQPQPKKTQKNQKPEGNAAPYYEKAMSLCAEMPEGLAESLRRATGPQNLDNKTMAALTQWLNANEKALAQVHLGSQKAYCSFPKAKGDKIAVAMPHLNMIKTLAKALQWRAQLQAANGLYSKALNDLTDCYTLGSHFVSGSTVLIEKLVGIAAQAIALNTTFRTLERKDLDPAFPAKVQTTFEGLAARYGRSFNLQGEKDKIKNDPAYRPFRQSLKGALEYYDLVAQKTPWQLKNDKAAEKLVSGNMLLQLSGSGMAKAAQTHYRTRAMTEALITTVAALRYKTDKAKVPQNLNELITSGYLKTLPMDPFSDKSLVYKPTGNSFTLYCLGADFDDDNGRHDSKWGDKNGDYVFWPVQ
jgi:hypothetical protein